MSDASCTPKILLDGRPADPRHLRTWTTYAIHASALVVAPEGPVDVRRLTETTHLLSTGGWMGELRVGTEHGWDTLRIQDPKLTTDTWNRLLDDLATAVAGLPLAELVDGAALDAAQGSPTRFVQRLVARAYANTIERAVEALQRRPHEAIYVHHSWVTPDRATTGSPAAIAAVAQRGAFTAEGAVARRLGGAAPTIWRDARRAVQTDTPENRFARHVLGNVLAVSRSFPDDDRLAALGKSVRTALARPPLRDAGPYRRFPATSRVLQRRHGYRELRDVHFALLGSARVRWDGLEAAIRGSLRNTEVLYQYWCYLALQRHLGVARPTLPYAKSPSSLHIDLAEGQRASIETPRGRLWHERSFDPPRASYAVPVRPDFALARPSGGWSVFDAKFRIGPQGDAKHPDLVKMHAYRDAIRGCHSATVIYPGDKPELFPATPNEPVDDPSGIGVLPLRP